MMTRSELKAKGMDDVALLRLHAQRIGRVDASVLRDDPDCKLACVVRAELFDAVKSSSGDVVRVKNKPIGSYADVRPALVGGLLGQR